MHVYLVNKENGPTPHQLISRAQILKVLLGGPKILIYMCALVILFYRGERECYTDILSKPPSACQRFQWRFAIGPMMAPDDGMIFQGGGGGLDPPDPLMDQCMSITWKLETFRIYHVCEGKWFLSYLGIHMFCRILTISITIEPQFSCNGDKND